MPHTSHKKKQARSKRQEVVGDDGWTHITSNKFLVKRVVRRSWVMEVTVVEAPAGLTQSDVLAKYVEMEKKWMASESWKSMEKTLKTRAISCDTRIDACVLFGSGTFTGLLQGWIDRRHVALCQLAAFKAVVDFIERCTGQRPAVYAQEPIYNTQDDALLSTLGIEKIEDPNGLDLLTSHSFAFCPGAEQHVVLETLGADPFLYLGGRLDSYRGALGYLQSSVIGVGYPVYHPEDAGKDGKEKWMMLDQIEELNVEMTDDTGAKLDEAWVREKRATQEPDVQVIERFLQNKETATVPDLDVQDQPLYDSCLYWPRQSG